MKSVVHNQDCLEAMRSMPDKAFDLAIVDPPYGISVNHSIGRRAGQAASGHARVRWDAEPLLNTKWRGLPFNHRPKSSR